MNQKVFLHILLVLTFIYAGLSCLSALMMIPMQPVMSDFYAANPDILPEEFTVVMQRYLELPRGFFLATALLYGLEVAGGVLMWNLRVSGFHCYTLARLLLLLVPLLFLGKGYVGLGEIMMAVLFIAVYWMLMKQLGVFNNKDKDEPEPEPEPEREPESPEDSEEE